MALTLIRGSEPGAAWLRSTSTSGGLVLSGPVPVRMMPHSSASAATVVMVVFILALACALATVEAGRYIT